MLYDDKELAGLLSKVKTIAVIGAVDKPGRAVHSVGSYLIEAGFTVIPVHPKRTNVWGLETYKSILDIPVKIDLVDLFRAAEFCPEHADEVLKLTEQPDIFWMQSGIWSSAVKEKLSSTSIKVIEDRCLMVDHRRLVNNKCL